MAMVDVFSLYVILKYMRNKKKTNKRVRKAIGKIAKDGITPIIGTNLVMIRSWRLGNDTGKTQIEKGTIYSVYDNQASWSKIHGPIKGFFDASEDGKSKKTAIIDNILPARKWSKGKHFRQEFWEDWI